MRIKNILSFVLIFTFFISSCKKDDKIEIVNIKGTVFNICTDSSLSNVTVYLITKTSSNTTSVSAISDTSGNFIFNNVLINHNSNHAYFLYIESKSGTGGSPSEIGFVGLEDEIDKNNLIKNHILPVIPAFRFLKIKVEPSVTIISPDTFTVYLKQNIVHKNQPERVYSITLSSSNLQAGYPYYSDDYIYNYPMGKWNITTNKTKSGVQSVINDSIYIGWGDTASYNVPW